VRNYAHYKAGDGRTVTQWFDESDLIMVEADGATGTPIFCVKVGDLLKSAMALLSCTLHDKRALISDAP